MSPGLDESSSWGADASEGFGGGAASSCRGLGAGFLHFGASPGGPGRDFLPHVRFLQVASSLGSRSLAAAGGSKVCGVPSVPRGLLVATLTPPWDSGLGDGAAALRAWLCLGTAARRPARSWWGAGKQLGESPCVSKNFLSQGSSFWRRRPFLEGLAAPHAGCTVGSLSHPVDFFFFFFSSFLIIYISFAEVFKLPKLLLSQVCKS